MKKVVLKLLFSVLLIASVFKGTKVYAETTSTSTDGKTVLFMHMDGKNGSTAFKDETGKAVHITGNPIISNTQSKLGGGSLYIPGDKNYLTVDGSDDFALDGDFTWESWIYLTDQIPKDRVYVIYDTGSTGGFGIVLYPDSVCISQNSCGPLEFINTKLPIKEWFHLAISRKDGIIKVFINGSLVGSAEDKTKFTAGQAIITATSGTSASVVNLPAYFDELRLTKGKALYTSNFNPSTGTENSTPINLTAKGGDSKIQLNWNAVSDATSYVVKRSETKGGPYTVIADGSAVSYTDTNVTAGKTYYYIVSAVSNGAQSTVSNEAAAISTVPVANKKLKLILEVKENKQLSVTDDLSDNTNMTWSSSDTAVASVDSNGMAKALKPGNTTITCTSKDGDYKEIINVLVVDLDLQLAVDLKAGDKCRLTVDDLADTTKVTWTSYDSTIATVTSKGKVTAVSEGLTYITAVDSEGNEIGRVYVRVR